MLQRVIREVWGPHSCTGPPDASRDHLDRGPVPLGAPESPVGGEEWRVEDFGQRDIDAVVSTQAPSELPNARKEDLVVVTGDIQIEGVLQRVGCDRLIDGPEISDAPQCVCDLNRQKVRCVERLFRRSDPGGNSLATVCVEDELDDRRSVEDDQRPSRSARMMSAGDSANSPVVRRAIRLRTSCRVGRSTTLRSSMST